MSKHVHLIDFQKSPGGDALRLAIFDAHASPEELAAALRDGPTAILLENCCGVDDLQRSDIALSVAEARAGLAIGGVAIVASAADSARGLLALQTLGGKSSRLAGLTWNRAALCRDLSCDEGSAISEHARIQLLVAARAFGLPAYDCLEGGEAADKSGRSPGFSGHVIVEG
jgi:citrate lyase beta subunit